MPLRHVLGSFALLVCPMVLMSCGGAAGGAVQPKDFKGAEALGAEASVCKDKPAFARPLTVDLDADTRSDLEASMQKGIVVVGYDCVHLRVLNNCTVPSGDYEYARVDRKEEIVQIKEMGDLKVNLPIGAAKLSGEIAAGRSIDLALVSIGRQSTTTFAIPKSELKGRCEGATHFVTKAFLGAFSLATNSSGKASGVAEMFSRSASASSSSERSGAQSNGSLEACRKAESDALTPTPECRTALRVELTPFEEDPSSLPQVGAKEAKRSVEIAPNPCREGYRLVDGLCTSVSTLAAAAKTGYLCDPKNADECNRECEKGNSGSCTNAGALALKRFPSISWEEASRAAEAFFKKACDAGDQHGCAGLLKATLADSEATVQRLLPIGKKACDAGVASACEEVGTMLNPEAHAGDKWVDADASIKFYDRGCRLGNAFACGAAGKVMLAKDVTKGVALYQRGCDGGDANVCNALASGLIHGKKNIPKDADRGAALALRACELDIDTCATSVGHLKDAGKPDLAFHAAKRGCEDKDVRTLDKDEQESALAYRGQACTELGFLYADGTGTTKDPAKAAAAFKSGCDAHDERACSALKKPKGKAKK